MKIIFLFLILLICQQIVSAQKFEQQTNENEVAVNTFLDNWHKAAATTDSIVFFDSMDNECIYIGTDKTERWSKKEFEQFAMPYFRKGKAWDFKRIERALYFSKDSKFAWFNETLDTWMGVCRASGVLQKCDKKWKIKHYHLSVAVPNDKIKEVIEIIKTTK